MAPKHQNPTFKSKTAAKKNLKNTPQQATRKQSELEKSKNAVQEVRKTKEEANTSGCSTWSPYMDGIVSLPKGMIPEQLDAVIDYALYGSRETASRFLSLN
jgi:uncharacterized protein YgiB involved in biofilm formation